jgi:hypothetical protein
MDLTRPLSLVQQVGEDACRALADRGDAVLQPEVGVGARGGVDEAVVLRSHPLSFVDQPLPPEEDGVHAPAQVQAFEH